jgi:DNA-binding transcriptional LysR family regulator
MGLDDALAFVTVVDAGSFTEAGRRLGVLKSTLSRQVSRLEERLGARLLHRTTRRLSLTETGSAYFERCQRAIEDIREAERVVQHAADRPRGTLKVSAPFDFARDTLAELLPEFRTRYPEITIVLVLTQRRLDLLEEGIDVALRGGTLPDSGLVARKLAGSEILLCASPAYLDRVGRPRTLADLARHDAVVMGPGGGMPTWRLRGPEGMVDVPLRPCIVANEWGVLRALIVAGVGVGLLIRQAAHADLAGGRLERVLPQYGLDDGGLYAVYPSRHHLTPKVRVFVDYLADALRHAF